MSVLRLSGICALAVVGITYLFGGASALDGLTYEGATVTSTVVEELDDMIILEVQSEDAATFTITMDGSMLAASGVFAVMVNGAEAEFEQILEGTATTISVMVPAGDSTVTLTGVAFMPAGPEAVEMAEAGPEAVEMAEAGSAGPEAVEMAEAGSAGPEAAEVVEAEAAAVADVSEPQDFVEAGVDLGTYVDRYLNDESFIAWYQQYYPDMPFYQALGITESEYQAIVDGLVQECPEGTELVDGLCEMVQPECGAGTELVGNECVVVDATATKATAAEVYEAQGSGLQLGVAAAIAFFAAVAIVLVLWLPNKWRRRRRPAWQ